MLEPLLYILVGVIASLLGSMVGLGGGSIAVPALYCFGLGIEHAVASSKFMVLTTSAVSTYRYSRRLRIPVKLYSIIALPMVLTSYLGAYLVVVVPSNLLTIIVGLVLLAAAMRAIVESGADRRVVEEYESRRNYLLGALSGFVAGIVAGITGLGGGVVNVPMFLYVLSLPAHSVVSLSMACILPAALSSTIRHVIDGIVLWKAALPLSVGAILGAWFGPKIALKLSRRELRKLIGIILAAVVLRMIIQAALTLNAF